MLPQSVQEVSFNEAEGKTGWSKYNQIETFRDTTPKDIFDAVKVGLGDAGFSLRYADLSRGVAVGEHGMTAHDWNIIAGVYFKKSGSDTLVKVIIEGSKDIGFSGDVTSDGWAGKILRGTREHLNRTNQAVIKVDRLDFKRSTNAPNRKTENDDLRRKLLRQYINKEITRQEYTELMKRVSED